MHVLDFKGRVPCQFLELPGQFTWGVLFLSLCVASFNHELVGTRGVFHCNVVFDDITLSLLSESSNRHHRVVLLWQFEELKHVTLLLLTILTLQQGVEISEGRVNHLWILWRTEHVTLPVLYFDGLIDQVSIETILRKLLAHLSKEIVSRLQIRCFICSPHLN